MFSDNSPPTKKKNDVKGKGKAVEVDVEEEEYEFDDIPEDEWERLDGGYNSSVGSHMDDDEGEEGAEEEEDDESDLEIIPVKRKKTPLGTTPKVNETRKKGPPIDSSPPKGSIYISTLRPEVREGCTYSLHSWHLSQHANADDVFIKIQDEQRYSSKPSPKKKPSEVQKMSATKKPFKPRGGGFRGRGGRRGGFRKRGGRK